MQTQLTMQSLGSGRPHLLIMAGVHGDEFEPMVAVRRLWQQLQSVVVRGRITLVPIANEPAFLGGQRVGEDGLDLARTMPGRSDGSSTERIAAALAPLIREADAFIDLHTGGRLFRILPLAGYMLHPDEKVLESQRRMARAFNCPIVWGTHPQLDGRTLSVARDAGVPAIYVEAGGGERFEEHAVELCVAGCLNVAGMLGIIERALAPSQVEHVVEDPRVASGHLQVMHPAPAAGYFVPSVELGDHVEAGQTWGTVVDPFGKSLGTVAAAESGLALFLRAVPAVRQGDSTGGVLPLN
ncbi:MAG: succinylglutamate desuccinylase/aspartoacylase family protein [Planctomycetaceae bacterium]|nr:succinylglutamate desuccinylase/aspartoacylase family protein [Planctomycetaceae bacterium]